MEETDEVMEDVVVRSLPVMVLIAVTAAALVLVVRVALDLELLSGDIVIALDPALRQ